MYFIVAIVILQAIRKSIEIAVAYRPNFPCHGTNGQHGRLAILDGSRTGQSKKCRASWLSRPHGGWRHSLPSGNLT